MALVYYDIDADLEILRSRTAAVLGYGDLGRAHACNLRDSGVPVIIGLPGDSGKDEAEADGFTVRGLADATRGSDVIAFMLPEHFLARLYADCIAPNIKPGAALAFTGGFAVHAGLVAPPDASDVFLVASKGPGHVVRRVYMENMGVPAFVAVYRDASGQAMNLALAYGSAIGAGRAGMIETTFAEEAESCLFSKQAVVCGGVSELIKAGFDTLVEAGYQPEIAYFDCLYEMKMAVDAIFEGGLSWMRHTAGGMANYCDSAAGRHIIDDGSRETMKRLLANVKDGSFAREWAGQNGSGRAEIEIEKWLRAERKHFIEKVGIKLRTMMPWMDQ